jgi:hypothetical protein
MEEYVLTCPKWIRLSQSMVCLSSVSPVFSAQVFSKVEDSDLVCQPGVGWVEINETLKEKGIPLFFPVCAES